MKRLVTPKTKAVLPVCFYGSTQNIREIWKEAKKYNLRVIVDAAQCFGIPEIVNFGDIIAFSFNPFKNIGGFGKGGGYGNVI